MPARESARLQALERYKILDAPPEEAFDRLTDLAAQMMDVPIALVSLVDRDRQWFMSNHGLQATETPREMAFCAHTICDQAPMVVPNALEDPRFAENPLVAGDPKIRFYAGAPLRTHDGHNLGTLCLIDREPREMSDLQQMMLVQLAGMVMEAFELRVAGQDALRALDEQETLSHEFHYQATTDSLTGALNRRGFVDATAQEWERSKRYGLPVSLLEIDIDHFKQINDEFGHDCGDNVLKALVTEAHEQLRGQDILGRVGGEEFMILAPHTSVESCRIFANRLKEALSSIRVSADGQEVGFTVSIGITECLPRRESPDDAIKRTDIALYAAKNLGRNRVASELAA